MERGAWWATARGVAKESDTAEGWAHTSLKVFFGSFMWGLFLGIRSLIAVAVVTPLSPNWPSSNGQSEDCYNPLCSWPSGILLFVTVSQECAGVGPHHPETAVVFTSFLILTPLIPSPCQMTSRWWGPLQDSPVSWRIPWTEEPGRLQSMGSHRVGHDWVTNTFFHLFTPRQYNLKKVINHCFYWTMFSLSFNRSNQPD